MDIKEKNRLRAQAQLARLKPNTGHARILRARLGIGDIEPVVKPKPLGEPIIKVVDPELKKPKVKAKKAAPKKPFFGRKKKD